MSTDPSHSEVSAPTRQWRVSRALPVLKGAGAVIFALVAFGYPADRAQTVVAGAGAAVLAVLALRDLVAPVRLAADATGLTVVSGYASRRHIPWRDIERIRVDERRRLGLRSQLLEIDTGQRLYLLSGYELTAAPEDVVNELRTMRTGR